MLVIILPPVASAPTNLTAVQESPTNIRVSWSPPTPLGDTIGYRIYYSGGSSGSEDVSDGSTDNYLLIGLQNGDIYNISIVATSQYFHSDALTVNIGLGTFTCIPAAIHYTLYLYNYLQTLVHSGNCFGVLALSYFN